MAFTRVEINTPYNLFFYFFSGVNFLGSIFSSSSSFLRRALPSFEDTTILCAGNQLASTEATVRVL